MLAQLSPIRQIQTLEQAVAKQLEGLLSLDFVGLWKASHTLLTLLSSNLGDEFQKQAEARLGVDGHQACDQMVKIVGVLEESLTGDLGKDEAMLSGLVQNVKNLIESGGANSLENR